MSVTFTAVQNGGVSADYNKYLYTTLSKTDRTNDPKLLDFSLVPWDASFIKLVRGGYITLTNATYGTWFTGFITNDPELEYFGTHKVSGVGTPVWGYKYEATSDEYLLNMNNIGIVPPFINTNQGTILKYLVNLLTPAGYTFNVSAIGNGQVIPRYVIDPTKKFSDVVKEFADAANYRFWAIGMALHFVQRDSVACAITVDGNNKHFTPDNLKIAPTSDSIINDVIVTGNIEPQNYVTEYYVGDGFTGTIPTMSSVFGADHSTLLDEDFSAAQTDLTKWTVVDTSATKLVVSNGFLNVLGGNNTNAYDVFYQSANLIPLEGNLRITHGEYDFLNSGTGAIAGIIGGLWTGNPARTTDLIFPGCVYGIRVEKLGTLRPIVNGNVDVTQGVTASTSLRYIIRTVISHQKTMRLMKQYSYILSDGTVGYLGGTGESDIVSFQTYITEIDPTTAVITNQFVWTNNNVALTSAQTFALYCPVVSNDLHCTVTGITLSTPMQVGLEIQKSGTTGFVKQIVGPNEIDSFDGLTPVATITDQNTGSTTKSSLLGTSQYNSAQAVLQFFNNPASQTTTIPQVGDLVHLTYRRPGAAIARVQDKVSIAAEGLAFGDTGLRSLTRSDLSPQPRNRFECELAASSIVKYTNYQHFHGSYTMENTPFITGVFSGEPLSGTVLKFQNLPASFPSYLQAEIVNQVQTTFDHSNGGECFTHTISFGSVDPAIAAVSRLRRMDDVFNPQDSIELPFYIDVSSVGNTFVGDVVAPTLMGAGKNYAQNGNFESGSTNWQIGAGVSLVTNPSNAHTGNNYIELTTTGTEVDCGYVPDGAPFATYIPVSPGDAVTFGGWINKVSGTGVAQFTLRFSDDLLGTNVNFFVVGNHTAGTGWQFATSTVTVPAGRHYLWLYCTVATAAVTARFDDILLYLPNDYYVMTNQAPPTGGGFEVRYTDESWGADSGKNLISRNTLNSGSSSVVFNIPRNNRGKTCFVKAFDTRNKCIWSDDITQWTHGANMGTVANTTQVGPSGNSSSVSNCTGGVTSGNNYVVSVLSTNAVVGESFAYSISAKGPAGVKLTMIVQDGASVHDATQVVTLNGHWQRFTLSGVFPTGATGVAAILVTFDDATALGKTAQIGNVSFEIATSSETLFCHTSGSAYGAMSRYASAIKVSYPLIPPAPTANVDYTNPILLTVSVLLPTVLTDVWGIEVRGADDVTVFYHADLTDASFSPSFQFNNNAQVSSLAFKIYTYNLLGEYSAVYNWSSAVNFIPTVTDPYNSGFELFPVTSIVADGWTKDFETAGTGFTYLRSTSAFSGNFAQAIANGGGGTSVASRPVGVKVNTRYTISCRAISTVANPGTMYLRVLWYKDDNSFSRGSSSESSVTPTNDIVGAGGPTAANTWAFFSAEFTSPSDAKFARVAIYNWTGTSCIITFDTVVIRLSGLSLADGAILDANLDHVANGTRAAWDSTTQKAAAVDINGNLLLKNKVQGGGVTSSPTITGLGVFVIPEMTTTITTAGNPVLITFNGTFLTNNILTQLGIRIYRDGTFISFGNVDTAPAANVPFTVATTLIDSVAAGSHTYEVRWLLVGSSSGTITAYGILRVFQVVELG